ATTNVWCSASNSARSGNSVRFVSINRIVFTIPLPLNLQLTSQFLQPGLPILIAIPFAERLGKYRERKWRETIRSLHHDPMGTDSSECRMHTRCLQLKVVHFIVRLS